MNNKPILQYIGIFAAAFLLMTAVVAMLSFLYIQYPGYFHPQNSYEKRTALVVYTDAGFEPPSISVRIGTYITFRNDSSKPFQLISDSGFGNQRCDNDYRGACAPILPGESWTAYFDDSQIPGYHDELNPSSTVIITVITLPSDMQPTLCDGVPCKI
jgi:hypothetical protein